MNDRRISRRIRRERWCEPTVPAPEHRFRWFVPHRFWRDQKDMAVTHGVHGSVMRPWGEHLWTAGACLSLQPRYRRRCDAKRAVEVVLDLGERHGGRFIPSQITAALAPRGRHPKAIRHGDPSAVAKEWRRLCQQHLRAKRRKGR